MQSAWPTTGCLVCKGFSVEGSEQGVAARVKENECHMR